jgi:hypothetical protein
MPVEPQSSLTHQVNGFLDVINKKIDALPKPSDISYFIAVQTIAKSSESEVNAIKELIDKISTGETLDIDEDLRIRINDAITIFQSHLDKNPAIRSQLGFIANFFERLKKTVNVVQKKKPRYKVTKPKNVE